uniref:N-acetylneuraminate lyase n=1 Tax=Oncorhynchus tshawytscha TaxID=74940 RepID=A0A8C8BTF4_ONCTS
MSCNKHSNWTPNIVYMWQLLSLLEQVIEHVGCMSLKDSQELARHADEIRADGIAVISPSFIKPATADTLRMFLQEVASAAPVVPFYYYHIPAVTGVNCEDVLEGIEKQIPSFQGLKFSGSALMDFGQCVSNSPSHWSLLYVTPISQHTFFSSLSVCLSQYEDNLSLEEGHVRYVMFI